MDKINLQVNGEGKQTIEILKGEALPQKEPKKIIVKGLINAPFEYLQKRSPEPSKSHLIVSKSEGSITLIVDEKNEYRDEIGGALSLNPDFEKFGINTGKEYDTFELADFIKMNRYFFADKSVAMKLVSDLKNFKAKVNSDIEKSDDNRGNTRFLQNKAVESNIPEAFDIVVPIFKGQEEKVIRVEINIDSRSLNCTLISPDANDIINETRSTLIDAQVEKIRELSPELPILEV